MTTRTPYTPHLPHSPQSPQSPHLPHAGAVLDECVLQVACLMAQDEQGSAGASLERHAALSVPVVKALFALRGTTPWGPHYRRLISRSFARAIDASTGAYAQACLVQIGDAMCGARRELANWAGSGPMAPSSDSPVRS